MFHLAENSLGRYAVPIESSYTFTSSTILKGLVHEAITIDYMIKNCGVRDVVHAGAGFGDFLPALSRTCIGKVFAFEPNRVNFLACQETIHLNQLSNIELYSEALGNSSKEHYLLIKENGLALGVRSETVQSVFETDELQKIKLVTLDEILLDTSSGVGIIHLDIEGHEFPALDGARKLIERDLPIIILEIDGRALNYNRYMQKIGYVPVEQLIYDAKQMVFVNTVYKHLSTI